MSGARDELEQDAEGGIYAVQAAGSVGGTLTRYVYNAEGVGSRSESDILLVRSDAERHFSHLCIRSGTDNEQMTELYGSGNRKPEEAA